MIKRLFYLFLIARLTTVGTLLAQSSQSVLQTGTWLKIGVTQTGVFRLDYATLTKANPAFAAADPRQFRLFGNGGTPLPQSNAVFRPTDLTENTIQVTGETDGHFDPTDAILFFGQSPVTIRYDSFSQRLTHQLNVYADTTFYFLTIGSSAGQRLANKPVGNTLTGTPITSYDEYMFREAELVKPILSGREWLGDAFQGELTQSRSFDFKILGRVSNTPVLIRSALMASSTAATTYFLQLNGSDIGSQTVEPVADVITRYTTKGMLSTAVFPANPSNADIFTIQITSNRKGGANASGYLDYLSIQLRREIRQYEQPTWVRVTAGRFVAKQATSALRIWDISNPLRPALQAYTMTNTDAIWSSDSLLRHDYFLFTDAQIQTPASLTNVANQNLHGQPTPNLLIVTPAAWQLEAERLAEFRRTNDKLSVLVVTTQQVYQEFSSGQPDPTAIRDMCRYFYQQNPVGLRYLLLFGDATFDYRNIETLLSPAEQANTVPTYESRESLHPLLSFSSDDYFGFLKESDGEWAENFNGDQHLDIGVGRLPVKSLVEAKMMVDKLMGYADKKIATGDWKSKLLFVADDGDDNIHQKDADQLAKYVETQALAYRPQRVFLDTFQQTTSTVGTVAVESAPLVNEFLSRAVEDGQLIVNYTGHGGIMGWAQEQILTLKDILAFKNKRLPLFVTATCEFGRYDDPSGNSGAEIALFNPTGGAIGLLTTTRPVFADKNLLINQAFYRTVFRPRSGQMPRLGDIMRITKDSSLAGVQNRNFTLLGDPSMQLAYPQEEIVLTGINGHSPTAKPADTLRPLQRVALTGIVRQLGATQPLTNFSGTVRLMLYDKPTSMTTLGTESSPQMVFSSYVNLLYSGQVQVQNGQFNVQFTLPKDLDPSIGMGRVYAYAVRTDGLTDAGGANDLLIGGVSSMATPDTQPPVIHISLADTTASQPYLTAAGPNVTILVELIDNEGINLSQAVKDHALTGQLDNQEPVFLSNYYTATTNDGRRGIVRYPIKGLNNGTYTIKVKAYDLSNNSSEATLTFIVSDKLPLMMRSLVAYPNPFQEQVNIEATHNRPDETLDWTLTVFDLIGKQVAERKGSCDRCPTQLITTWDGRNDTSIELPNGLYVYRLQLRSNDDIPVVGSGKLLLIR